MSTDRRLAAILAADVVGFSQLMGQDEAGTLEALKALRAEVIDPKIAEQKGRIFKTTGDGVLAEFTSVVNAVACAVDIQRGVARRNADLPEDRAIQLRIGVNLGDVIVEGMDVFGDGVNVAARLEGVAPAGGIAVSGTVRDHLGNRLDLRFEDMGDLALKNIDKPVRVLRVHLDAPGQVARTAPLTAKPSIAVLPFQNMSGDPEQEYFADGITEDIITELSRFRSLSVIARNSSFTFKGKSTKIADVARDLGVGFVVEGSVRRLGNRVRITAQLINASTGDHVWAERYDRSIDDLFAVQDEVVRSIAATTEGRLAHTIVDRTVSKPTPNIAAHELVLQARHALGTFDLQTAEPLLRNALMLDPNYAQSYAYMSMIYLIRFFNDHELDTIDQCVVMGRKAVSLDDSNSTCHAHLGFGYTFKGQFQLAEFHSERAVALNPADTYALAFRAHWLSRAGRPAEALQLLDEMLRVDPYPPSFYWENRAVALITLGRFEEAIESTYRKSQKYWWDHYIAAVCFAHLGQLSEARDRIAELLRERPSATIHDIMKSEPYKNPQNAQLLMDGLREAGVPE